MSNKRYVRDKTTGAIMLADSDAVAAFCQKKTLDEDIEAMKAEINNLKRQVAELQHALKITQASD